MSKDPKKNLPAYIKILCGIVEIPKMVVTFGSWEKPVGLGKQ